jgi:hypothetical protein
LLLAAASGRRAVLPPRERVGKPPLELDDCGVRNLLLGVKKLVKGLAP